MDRNVVAIISLVLLLSIVGFDVYLALDSTKANTFSATWRRIPRGITLLIVFALGLVVGHLWWT